MDGRFRRGRAGEGSCRADEHALHTTPPWVPVRSPRCRAVRPGMLGPRCMRRYWDALLAYPRFMGAIKPSLRSESPAQIKARLAALSGSLWPKRLRAPLGKSILAFSPHPDDEVIGAGGLLLAHRGRARISVVTVFNGDAGGRIPGLEGPAATDPVALARARELEIAAVAIRLGALNLGCLGFSDGVSSAMLASASDRLRALVDQTNPDVVIMPSPFDAHEDHRAANLLWANACGTHRCMVLGSEIWSLIAPNAYFEITDQLEEKLDLIRIFSTQTATIDYVGMSSAMARVRGFHEGCGRERFGAAEAFFALPNNDYCEVVRAMCAERVAT
jgi:N-acetylglucosamine malate deacetylase 1